jgi:hypothetical protein
MNLNAAFLAVLTVLQQSSAAVSIDGNTLLREEGKLHPLPPGYSVRIDFSVHFHRPLPLSFPANANLFFRAPDRQALVITNVPGVIARRLEHAYNHIDVVPQDWYQRYNVISVTPVTYDRLPALELNSIPNFQGVTHTILTLLRSDLSAVGAKWIFADGSTVQLTAQNAQIGGYLLPVHEDIAVDMPSFSLDAVGDQTQYVFNAAIPDAVFAIPNR